MSTFISLEALSTVEEICKDYNINPNILDAKFKSRFIKNINWDYVSERKVLSEAFVREFSDQVNWTYVFAYQKLSDKFFSEFSHKVKWNYVSQERKSSEEYKPMKTIAVNICAKKSALIEIIKKIAKENDESVSLRYGIVEPLNMLDRGKTFEWTLPDFFLRQIKNNEVSDDNFFSELNKQYGIGKYFSIETIRSSIKVDRKVFYKARANSVAEFHRFLLNLAAENKDLEFQYETFLGKKLTAIVTKEEFATFSSKSGEEIVRNFGWEEAFQIKLIKDVSDKNRDASSTKQPIQYVYYSLSNINGKEICDYIRSFSCERDALEAIELHFIFNDSRQFVTLTPAYIKELKNYNDYDIVNILGWSNLMPAISPVAKENVAKKPSAEEPEKAKKMSLVDQFKSDGTKASYRVVSTQMVKGTKQAILTVLKNKGHSNEHVQAITEMLDTEIGNALVSGILGYALTYAPIPQVQNNKHAQVIAEEFRVNAMATVGNEAIGLAMEHFLPVLTSALEFLPKENETVGMNLLSEKLRVATEQTVELETESPKVPAKTQSLP